MIIDRKKLGKKGRAAGKSFELKVRADLEKQGWIVFRNHNDVEFEMCTRMNAVTFEHPENCKCNTKGKFKQAKSKWNPFTKMPMALQSGFPDFVCIQCHEGWDTYAAGCFEVQFVECKIERNIDKIEKAKVEWLKSNFHIPIVLARRGEKRGTIKYDLV